MVSASFFCRFIVMISHENLCLNHIFMPRRLCVSADLLYKEQCSTEGGVKLFLSCSSCTCRTCFVPPSCFGSGLSCREHRRGDDTVCPSISRNACDRVRNKPISLSFICLDKATRQYYNAYTSSDAVSKTRPSNQRLTYLAYRPFYGTIGAQKKSHQHSGGPYDRDQPLGTQYRLCSCVKGRTAPGTPVRRLKKVWGHSCLYR
jgi:hypothetical protein